MKDPKVSAKSTLTKKMNHAKKLEAELREEWGDEKFDAIIEAVL